MAQVADTVVMQGATKRVRLCPGGCGNDLSESTTLRDGDVVVHVCVPCWEDRPVQALVHAKRLRREALQARLNR